MLEYLNGELERLGRELKADRYALVNHPESATLRKLRSQRLSMNAGAIEALENARGQFLYELAVNDAPVVPPKVAGGPLVARGIIGAWQVPPCVRCGGNQGQDLPEYREYTATTDQLCHACRVEG